MIINGMEVYRKLQTLQDFQSGGAVGYFAGLDFNRAVNPHLSHAITLYAEDWGITDSTNFSVALASACQLVDEYVFIYSDSLNFCLPEGMTDPYYDGTNGKAKKIGAPQVFVSAIRRMKLNYPTKKIIYWGPSAYTTLQPTPEYLASIPVRLGSLPFDGITVMLHPQNLDAEMPGSLYDKVFSSQPITFAQCDSALAPLKLPPNLTHNFLETQLLSLGGKNNASQLKKIDWYNEDQASVIAENCKNWAAAAQANGITRFIIDNEDYSISDKPSTVYTSWCGYRYQLRANQFTRAQMDAQVKLRASQWSQAMCQACPTAEVMLPLAPVYPGHPYYARPDPAGGTGVFQELQAAFTRGFAVLEQTSDGNYGDWLK